MWYCCGSFGAQELTLNLLLAKCLHLPLFMFCFGEICKPGALVTTFRHEVHNLGCNYPWHRIWGALPDYQWHAAWPPAWQSQSGVDFAWHKVNKLANKCGWFLKKEKEKCLSGKLLGQTLSLQLPARNQALDLVTNFYFLPLLRSPCSSIPIESIKHLCLR